MTPNKNKRSAKFWVRQPLLERCLCKS